MRHLKIYRAIRLIRREGSIRKAAEYLSVSPSALNRQVQSFEDEIAMDVFERIPGGVRLSSAGELLSDMIDRHLTEFDNLQGQLNNMRDGLTGTLRISLGSDLDAGLVPDCVAGFAAENPGVSVEVVADDGTGPLLRRAVDLAILSSPKTDEAVEVMFAQPMPLVAWGRGEVAGLWEATGHRLVLPPLATGTRIAVSHLLRKHRLEEGVTTTVSASQSGTYMAQDETICILPQISGPVAAANILGLKRFTLPLGTVQISALRAARGVLTRPAQTFLGQLQRRLDEAATGPTA